MMAAAEMLRGTRGKAAELVAKDNHMSLYPSSTLTLSVPPSLVSGFYLRGDCGLALSQHDRESNISHYMET